MTGRKGVLTRAAGLAVSAMLLAASSAFAEPAQIPGWLAGWMFKGDVRLRYEGIFDDTGPLNNRARLRLRLGVSREIDDWAEVGIRMATGSTTEPTSTNITLSGGFGGKSFLLDQAWLKLKAPMIPGFAFTGGKFPVPYEHTGLVWDDDLEIEGFSESLTGRLGTCEFHGTAGQFFFNNSATQDDGYILGEQLGLSKPGEAFTAGGYAALYRYVRPDQITSTFFGFGSNARAGGNLVSGYSILDILFHLGWPHAGRGWEMTLEGVKNLSARPHPSTGGKEGAGYLFELRYGAMKDAGEWDLTYRYARAEADAYIGAFGYSDFGTQQGVTNTLGHKGAVRYKVSKHVWFAVTGYFTRAVLASAAPNRTRVQVDVNAGF